MLNRLLAATIVTFTLPAQAQTIPTIVADMSKAKAPAPPIEPGIRGYGTRGVEGDSLVEMKSSCAATISLSPVKAARCDQLRRTLRTQPSNTR